MPAPHSTTKKFSFKTPDGSVIETTDTRPYKFVIAYKEDDGTWRALGFFVQKKSVEKKLAQLNRHWNVSEYPLFTLSKPSFEYIYQ